MPRRSSAKSPAKPVYSDDVEPYDESEPDVEETRPEKSREKKGKRDVPAIAVSADTFNEQVLIAACMADVEAAKRITTAVRSDQFVGEGHAVIMGVIERRLIRGKPLSPRAIRGDAGKSIEIKYLEGLLKMHPKPPPALSNHISMMRWDSARARLVSGPLTNLVRALQDPTTPREKLQALARSIPDALDGQGDRQFMFDSKALVDAQIKEIEDRKLGQAIWPYGIDNVDFRDPDTKQDPYCTPGAAPGQITLVTGVSGSGKSTFLIRICLGLAEQKRKVLFGAWEMKGGLTLELLATFSLGWSRRKLSLGQVSDSEIKKLRDEMLRLSEYVKFWKFPWSRRAGQQPKGNDEVLDKIQGYIGDSGADVVFFDLLERSFADRKIDTTDMALERLQVMADETQVHMIWAHQQRLKDIEKRTDNRPTREGIKGTSRWVDVPDTIIGVNQPSLWKNVPNDTLEVIYLKQRYGPWPIGVELDWDPDRALILNGRPFEYKMSAGGGDRPNQDDNAVQKFLYPEETNY